MAFTFGLGITPMFPLRFGAASATHRARPARRRCSRRSRRSASPTSAPRRPPTRRCCRSPTLDEALKTLRYCISAGEHLPEATWRAWKERTGIAIIDGIGSTEMMHIFVSAAGDDIRPGSTGKAVPGYEATVLDADGQPLTEGVGRLAIKGPTGCRYLDDPRQRDYVVEWLERHRRHLPPRRRRLLLVPRAQRRHDRQLGLQYRRARKWRMRCSSHPAVAECAVIGVPCPERGQKVKAFVVLARISRAAATSWSQKLQAFVKDADRPLQISARDRVRRRAAQDRDGQAQAE